MKLRFAATPPGVVTVLVLCCLGCLLGSAAADATDAAAESGGAGYAGRADGHAPIGVMGDHVHAAGEFMLSYRYMRMEMSGNRDGATTQSTDEALLQFPVTPTKMDMEMHMLGGMWAPHDRVTLMVMVPFVSLDMRHRTRSGIGFTTRSSGLGDVRASALVTLLDTEVHHLHLNAGLSFPTGSVGARDDTPAGNQRLPYPMQRGSGTYDPMPGLTYTGSADAVSWGAQVMGTIRTGINRKGYRLGDRLEATGWVARPWTRWFSTSLRLEYQRWFDVFKADPALNPSQIPTAAPNLRGGERLDILLGLNFLVTGGPFAGNRFAVEAGRPVYQHLDGPQLETDWRLTAGWQYAF